MLEWSGMKAYRRAGIVFALLLACPNCGGRARSDAAGDAPASDAAAPGVDAGADADLARECLPFVPCGGALVGSWRFESTCDDHAVKVSGCQQLELHGMQDVGTIEFFASGAYGEDDTFSEQQTDINACPDVTCADFQANMLQLYESQATNTTVCSPQTSPCQCEVDIVTPVHLTGAYTISGTTVTLTNAQMMPSILDYCVTGDEAVMHSQPDPSSAFGGGWRLLRN
jgi:hypothetical protein